MSDEEYIEFVNKYQNKSFVEIEPIELREKIIKAFASINSNVRKNGERSYNEMYASNPTVSAVFAYDMHFPSKIGNAISFLNEGSVNLRTNFLQQYAIDNDLPMIVFGD